MSVEPEDLQRVVPERLSKGLDIHLQGLLVAAFASADEAIPILTALANCWEALNPEIEEGDLRQQTKVLGGMLDAMIQSGPARVRADAQRCLTRLNHFIDVQLSEVLRQSSDHRAEVTPTLQTAVEQADGSIKSEDSEKIDSAFHQRIHEQYGAEKPVDEVNQLL